MSKYVHNREGSDGLFAYPLSTIPLPQFCKLTGYKPERIRSRIARGDWAEGQHYVRDPAGNIQILIRGYERWVKSNLRRGA